MSKNSQPPKGFFTRSMKLISMATRVASQEMSQKVFGGEEGSESQVKTRVAQAKAITEVLSQLKGAAMKSGQLLSLDASDFLPPEAAEVLAQLQNSAEPMDFEIVKEQIIDDLGEEKLKLFENLSEEAEAAASIGQVHSAHYKGEKLAVKVQYPGVADSIESDLSLLRKIAKSFSTMYGKSVDLAPTFAEIERVLINEADYTKERANLERYRHFVGNDPDYVVPRSIPELSGKKVLSMTWEEGHHLGTWIRRKPNKEDKERIGAIVLDLFCKEFVDWGFVQTDPNFANFLITNDSRKVILIDFGATLEYSETFRREYAQILLDLTSNDSEKMFKSVVEFELLDERESDETKEKFKKMLQVSLSPFSKDLQPFDFTDVDFEKDTRQAAIEFSKSLKYSAPPRKVLFLHRKLGGIFNLMKKLDIRLDLMPYWERMTAPAQNSYQFKTPSDPPLEQIQ